jgi:hypothetical protein
LITVYIPALLQPLTGGRVAIEVGNAATVRQVVEELDRLHPGIAARLVEEGGARLRPNISVAVDGEIAPLGLREPVPPSGEVHFVTAIKGGRC